MVCNSVSIDAWQTLNRDTHRCARREPDVVYTGACPDYQFHARETVQEVIIDSLATNDQRDYLGTRNTAEIAICGPMHYCS
jgi:hypothetical protein